MQVKDCCSSAVVVAQRGTGVVEAARLMRNHHVGVLVVVAEGNKGQVPVGMVTDRDLVVEVMADGVPASDVAVGDVMSTELAVARLDEDLLAAMSRMRVQGVRRVPVVDSEGVLKGILSVDDALAFLADAVGDVPQIVRNQRDYEADRHPGRY
jgi:predicted transcriptional regulator